MVKGEKTFKTLNYIIYSCSWNYKSNINDVIMETSSGHPLKNPQPFSDGQGETLFLYGPEKQKCLLVPKGYHLKNLAANSQHSVLSDSGCIQTT